MSTWTADFKDFQSIIDEIIGKIDGKTHVIESNESDLVNKYKKLYEASVRIENLKQRRESLHKTVMSYNDSIAVIDAQIEELNKLFTN